jgi:hypothetical protein
MDTFKEIDNIVSKANVDVTPEDIENIRLWLYQYYKDIGYSGSIAEKTDEVLKKASEGWKRAPKGFYDRLRHVIGRHALYKYEKNKKEKNILQVKTEKPAKETVEEVKEKFKLDTAYVRTESVFGESLFDYLRDDEKLFWQKRENEYRKEFDFNESSDKVLLDEALYLEILLRRIRLSNITGDYKDLVKGLKENDIVDNHRRVLEKLGLLRVQRIQYDQNIEGNVGEISLILEEKMAELKNLKEEGLYKKSLNKINDKYRVLLIGEIEDLIEEASLLKEVEKMPQLNPIPQAIYAKISKEITKDVKGIEGILNGEDPTGTSDEELGSSSGSERRNASLFA